MSDVTDVHKGFRAHQLLADGADVVRVHPQLGTRFCGVRALQHGRRVRERTSGTFRRFRRFCWRLQTWSAAQDAAVSIGTARAAHNLKGTAQKYLFA